MQNIICALLVLLCASCATIIPTTQQATVQQPNQQVKDAYGNDMLLGRCNRFLLQREAYRSWFQTGYEQYANDQATTSALIPLLKDITIEIFLGTWCGDSKREVPRMLKILDRAGVDSSRVQLIFVSNDPKMYKQSPQHEEAGKQIIRVPTLIVYEQKKEIGRIVEYPVVSIEKDLYTILTRQPYQPNYMH